MKRHAKYFIIWALLIFFSGFLSAIVRTIYGIEPKLQWDAGHLILDFMSFNSGIAIGLLTYRWLFTTK